MKVKISEDSQRMLMLLKLDAKRVFERIKYRAPEYLGEFSLKRTREHFRDVFKNRYEETTIKELMLCGQEVIVGLDQYYNKIDEIRWYLNHTQDMPNRVEDKMASQIRELESYFDTLNLYIDVEMGLLKENQNEVGD
jgi:Mg2+ and Co2+ transporter CorA